MTKKHKHKEHSNKQNKWQKIAEESDQVSTDLEDEQPEQQSSEEGSTADVSSILDMDDNQPGLEYPSHQKLEDQLTAMERQVDEYKNKAARAHAELENIRRRAERDVSNAHKFGVEKLIIDLLPIIDSLHRALQSNDSQDSYAQSICEGISLTLELIHKTLEKHGVESINPQLGDAFNPDLHEAISMAKDPQFAPNTVMSVVQPGYLLNGRVVRAAMVIVAG